MEFSIFVSLLLLCSPVMSLQCTGTQVYAKVSKQSTTAASEESYEIWNTTTRLVTSPVFENNHLRTIEYCLDPSVNNQYILKLKDSYGDSWASGAWLRIEGLYDNIVFKNFMTAKSLETYVLSLYYAIKKTEQWKMVVTTVSGSWTENGFDDSSWSVVTLGSVTTQPTGPQYFRKTFTGLAGMAAYELSMNYRYGIVAYINGAEIYRDNMPVGVPTPQTAATGGYSEVSYHAIIRSGTEVENTQSVLALELHFTNPSNLVDFDSFLALYASSVVDEENKCFIYPYSTSVMRGTANAGTAFDFIKYGRYRAYNSYIPYNLQYTFNGATPFVNAIRIWPYTTITYLPTNFIFQGRNGTSNDWVDLITGQEVTYQAQKYHLARAYFIDKLYSDYRLRVTSHGGNSGYLYEIQPLTCSIVLPSGITYEPNQVTAYALYVPVEMKPTISEFTNCQITPPLPAGISIDAETCVISGVGESNHPATVYTITSTINGHSYQGTVTITLTACLGTFVSFTRNYRGSAPSESFTVVDLTSQQLVYNVGANSGQRTYSTVVHTMCLTGSRYQVTVSSTLDYWDVNSYLLVEAMLDDSNKETIGKYRFNNQIGIPSIYTFNIQYAVRPGEQWQYNMGTVPLNWYSSAGGEWSQSSKGFFPESSNQIQLYRKSFTISSTANAAAVVLSLRYLYGFVIYLNGHEVARKGFTSDLSTTTLATTSFTSLSYHQITLPIKTIATESASSVYYIVEGLNTIAVGLVAINAQQVSSDFDCAVRLMGTTSSFRLFSTSISGYLVSNLADLDKQYNANIYSYSCTPGRILYTFNNDRREWINSLLLRSYATQVENYPVILRVVGQNPEDAEPVTLAEVNGMAWSLPGQTKRIWLNNNKAYNKYSILNISKNVTTNCYWRLSAFDLYVESTSVTIPPLTYSSAVIFKNIEMAEIYSSTDLYCDYSITPSLPQGVVIDSATGTLSGTAVDVSPLTVYTISARPFTGGSFVNATLSLSVEICTGVHSLITLVVRTDNNQQQASYTLYQGRGTAGSVVSSIDRFYTSNALNYGDFCLDHGIYTIELKDTSNGWDNPAGYYLSVDVGAMKFEMGQVYKNPGPASVTTTFSSFLPFQIEYDDWKVLKNSPMVEGWNTIDFDDTTWTVTKAAAIGTSSTITVYIRREVVIPSLEDYHVLNVRVKYAGGVVAYFNGNTVARFNLEEDFTSESESLGEHDPLLFSVFHIVLPSSGVVLGKNSMAFEVHRPLGASSADPVVFDATGVFGVNDCSVVLDSYMNLNSSSTYIISQVSQFFDLTPVTYGYVINAIGSFVEWSVENLEGTRFNSFGMQTVQERSSFGFSLYGRELFDEENTCIFEGMDLKTKTLGRAVWDVPAAISPFRHFRYEIDDPASSYIYFSAFIHQYCKSSSDVICPGMEDYPPVGEGQISPSKCPYGYRGYAYRECLNGQLGPVLLNKCLYRIPGNLLYTNARYILVQDTVIQIPEPTYDNIITKFYLAEHTYLPEGLTLNEETGTITGTPTHLTEITTYTIFGENPAGVVSTTVDISVRVGECKAEGLFKGVKVGEFATFECSLLGGYIGTQKRACILGERDGTWQKTQGFCLSIFSIVLLVLVIVFMISICVLLNLRSGRYTKAVGGVKKKGSSLTMKSLERKANVQAVKV